MPHPVLWKHSSPASRSHATPLTARARAAGGRRAPAPRRTPGRAWSDCSAWRWCPRRGGAPRRSASGAVARSSVCAAGARAVAIARTPTSPGSRCSKSSTRWNAPDRRRRCPSNASSARLVKARRSCRVATAVVVAWAATVSLTNAYSCNVPVVFTPHHLTQSHSLVTTGELLRA